MRRELRPLRESIPGSQSWCRVPLWALEFRAPGVGQRSGFAARARMATPVPDVGPCVCQSRKKSEFGGICVLVASLRPLVFRVPVLAGVGARVHHTDSEPHRQLPKQNRRVAVVVRIRGRSRGSNIGMRVPEVKVQTRGFTSNRGVHFIEWPAPAPGVVCGFVVRARIALPVPGVPWRNTRAGSRVTESWPLLDSRYRL